MCASGVMETSAAELFEADAAIVCGRLGAAAVTAEGGELTWTTASSRGVNVEKRFIRERDSFSARRGAAAAEGASHDECAIARDFGALPSQSGGQHDFAVQDSCHFRFQELTLRRFGCNLRRW